MVILKPCAALYVISAFELDVVNHFSVFASLIESQIQADQ